MFNGAEEAIFVLANVLLGPGDHAIVAWPSYQSLHEVARSTGADVSLHELRPEDGWALDVAALRARVTPRTRLVVLNVPHNPTGAVPDDAVLREVADIAADAGATLLVDEVYRFLEHGPGERLPAGADLGPHVVSVGVMSKSFALAGLRIGWLATHDAPAARRGREVQGLHDDLRVGPGRGPRDRRAPGAGPRPGPLPRDRRRRTSRSSTGSWPVRPGASGWTRPRGGPVGFPELTAGAPVDRFADDLLAQEGVLLAPGSVFGHPGNHFRLGFGRDDLPIALERLEAFADRTL